MTTAIHPTQPHTAVAERSIITISTTVAAPIQNAPGTSWRPRPDAATNSLARGAVGGAAWVLAAVVGIVLGLAIGLVSAGFDTTRLLLAAGAVALGIGWLIALVTSPSVVGRIRR